jgi:hypothetical protein
MSKQANAGKRHTTSHNWETGEPFESRQFKHSTVVAP